MEILRTNKNDLCFLIDNSIFKCDKKVKILEENAVKYYCHCSLRPDGCFGRAVVTIFVNEEKTWKITKDHNGHAACLQDMEALKFRNKLKSCARSAPEKSSREVYDEVMVSVLSQIDGNRGRVDEIVSAVPDFVCMESSIQRARMEGRPVIPLSLDQVNIGGEWTKNLSGDDFLLFQTNGSEKIIGFATQQMLERLCDSPFVIMDGTFRVSPLLFTQLYTLHGQYRGGIFCFMYILLPNKRRETYEEVLRLIEVSARRIGRSFQPIKFLLDYEEAMILALRSHFPSASIKGCLFHFTQAVWRNCQAIGLSPYYTNNQQVRRFIKGLMALPFVPLDEIDHALDILRSNLPPNTCPSRPLIDRLERYFHRTWMTGSFSPVTWNCYMNFNLRTTNHVEGWHRKLNAKVKVAHPTIFKFIRHIQEEERSAANRMIELDNGHRVMPMVKKYKNLNRQIASLTIALNNGEIELRDYLSAMSNQISDSRPIINHLPE